MSDEIQTQFEKLGARVKVSATAHVPVSIDVRSDRHGEYFVVRHARDVEVRVWDVTPWDRHLVLSARVPRGAAGEEVGDAESTFLCGRDERHWFVAAIPESANARTVQAARDALKPA